MNVQAPAQQEKINAARRRLGVGLFRLAVRFSRGDSTQAQRENAIKELKRRRRSIDGKSSVRYLRDQVDACSNLIRSARTQRIKNRARSVRPNGVTRPKIAGVLRIQTGGRNALEHRLADRLSSHIKTVMRKELRLDSAGSLNVSITRDPSDVGVQQPARLDYSYYGKSYPGAVRPPKKIVDTTITIPAAWRLRVQRRGLAEVDGLITLDAQQLEGTQADFEVFAATWLQQGRGYTVSDVRGYIARHIKSGETYHGKTAEQALRGVHRKLGTRKANAKLQNLLDKHGLDQIVTNHPDLDVTLNDARNAGACEYGIKAWCERCDLHYEDGSATLAEVYESYQQHPVPPARAAILNALRRHRRTVMKSA